MLNSNLNNNKESTLREEKESANKITSLDINNLDLHKMQTSATSLFGTILFAEAGKKKKKEKSEVVVISVNNPSKGHGGMYPMFVPTCSGGHGYGRRKRSVVPWLR